MDTMPPDLTGLHNESAAHGLRRADLHSDPLQQFGAWFAAALAADIRDVNAMSLATASPDGKPSVRIVLLKGFDERGFAFFTNYDSEKGRQIEANPYAALVFYWAQLERQVRISGAVEKHRAKIPPPTFIRGRSAAGSAPGFRSRARSSTPAKSSIRA